MSIEVDWNRLTGGPEGELIAESIRAFIHDRFQQVQLPRFIRSVKAHSFTFGDVTPEVEIKDVCDPLPDFYESDEDDESPEEKTHGLNASNLNNDAPEQAPAQSTMTPSLQPTSTRGRPPMPHLNTKVAGKEGSRPRPLESPGLMGPPRSATAGIPGGTSNMSYFHLPLSAGLSGTSTPMGTAGARFGGSLLDHLHHNSSSSNLHRAMSLPPQLISPEPSTVPEVPGSPSAEQSATDMQIVAHLRYDGNVRLSLTAEVAFDFPMQSFVGIPLQLNVTGLTFDGVAILAYIKHKAHFCFLAPEDADALVGGDTGTSIGNDAGKASHEEKGSDQPTADAGRKPVGRLFEEIRVESEIGEREKGKQVLKNIGKVEKFVLDQVRRIFENELVYPSFWTFLV